MTLLLGLWSTGSAFHDGELDGSVRGSEGFALHAAAEGERHALCYFPVLRGGTRRRTAWASETSTSRRTTAPWVYLCGTRLDRPDAAGARWSWPSAHTGPTSTRSDSLTHTLSTKQKNPYIYGKKRQHFYCKKYGSNI